MSEKEFKLWKQRKIHADYEWRQAGYLVGEYDSGFTGTNILHHLDAYRGDFPSVLTGGLDRVDQMVSNIIFSMVNTMVAQQSGKIPDAIVRPHGMAAADATSRKKAWLNEQLIEFLMKEKKYKREMDMLLLSSVLTGIGVVRHGYTPEVEFVDKKDKIIARFKNQTPDMPWIQFLRPWQIRIDPMVNSFEPDSEPRWCAFHNLYFEHQIRSNENLKFRDDLKPTHFRDIRAAKEAHHSGSSHDPERMEMYEEWVFYDADERKFFGISPGSEKLIREESQWPFDWGQLPYSIMTMNDQIDTPFPVPPLKMIYHQQMLTNKIWTIINATVSRLRQMMIVNKDQFDDAQLDMIKNPDAMFEALVAMGDARSAVAFSQATGIDGNLIGLLFQLKEAIGETLGVSSFDRGQRANVETASEANQIGQGGAVTRGRSQQRFEATWTNVIRTAHRTFLQSEDARELALPIIGKRNLDFLSENDQANGFINVRSEDLQGEYSYDVKLDSTLRSDPNTQLARTITGYNAMGGQKGTLVDQKYYHEKIAELTGEDPEQAIVSDQVAKEMAKQGDPDQEAPPADGVESTAQQGVSGGLQGLQGGLG